MESISSTLLSDFRSLLLEFDFHAAFLVLFARSAGTLAIASLGHAFRVLDVLFVTMLCVAPFERGSIKGVFAAHSASVSHHVLVKLGIKGSSDTLKVLVEH